MVVAPVAVRLALVFDATARVPGTVARFPAAAGLAVLGSDAERCATGRRTAAVVLPAPAAAAFAGDRLAAGVAGATVVCLVRLAPVALRVVAGVRGFTIPVSEDDAERPVAEFFPLTALAFLAGCRTATGSAALFFAAAFTTAAFTAAG
ncbi:hypothetical protein Ait01nite_031020 [Actinoplanes italicus]|uniref:Uncharacterized protein n=1 Tax=Actinoplanes italicus TaxID=113567 RepID=A0A2T0KJ52_9ACTN|nr:hypothetical protein [Actinoplanes italicus]PRX23559.1 hypothetical protein CLV67_103308 [Actinoplanes italicus]GIE30057.1 hypothetical protein Ait01nite_031020 [Actinoplanes italicus]